MRRLALLVPVFLLFGIISLASRTNPTQCDERGCSQTLQERQGQDLFTPYNWQASPKVPARHAAKHSTSSIADLIAPLATKVQEILGLCHSHVVSAYRPGAHVAGTGHPSLHSTYPARAADLAGNPSCIYGQLHGWKGGYSVDYGAVRHVHLSWSPPGSGHLAGREWGARFVHGGGSHSHRYARANAVRHAARHHHIHVARIHHRRDMMVRSAY